MKAAVCERYGPPEVVQIRNVAAPVPADNEVLVKGAATTVNSGDARVRALRVQRGMSLPVRLKLGFSKPKQPVLGFERRTWTAAQPLQMKGGTFRIADGHEGRTRPRHQRQ